MSASREIDFPDLPLRSADDFYELVAWVGADRVVQSGTAVTLALLKEIIGEHVRKPMSEDDWIKAVVIMVAAIASMANDNARLLLINALAVLQDAGAGDISEWVLQ